MSTQRFKIGDRVKNVGGPGGLLGKTGVITSDYADSMPYSWYVQLDEDDYPLAFYDFELELIPTEMPPAIPEEKETMPVAEQVLPLFPVSARVSTITIQMAAPKREWKLKSASPYYLDNERWSTKPTLDELIEEITILTYKVSRSYWKWEDMNQHPIACIKDVSYSDRAYNWLADAKKLVDWCRDNKVNIKFVEAPIYDDEIPY